MTANEFTHLVCHEARHIICDISGKVFKRGSKGLWKELTGTIDSGGYKRIAIRFNGLRKNLRAHRIVWCYYNGAIPDEMTIHHRDHDTQNNALGNLELMTNEENARIKNPTNTKGVV